MAFVPPLFSKIGKSTGDLLSKKYDYKNVVQTRNRAANGTLFTSAIELQSDKVVGQLKAKYSDKGWGDAEGELSTEGVAKGTLTFKKLADNLTVTVSGDATPSAHPTVPAAKALFEFTQEFFSGALSYETSFFQHNNLAGSAVIGLDGLSVGGEIKVDLSAKDGPESARDIEDFNIGAQYAQKDFTISAKTKKKGDILVLGYNQVVSKDLTIGAEFETKMDFTGRKFTVGETYAIDNNTTFKGKVNTDGVASTFLETRLANPMLAASFAASFSLKAKGNQLFKPVNFGVGLTFGEPE